MVDFRGIVAITCVIHCLVTAGNKVAVTAFLHKEKYPRTLFHKRINCSKDSCSSNSVKILEYIKLKIKPLVFIS